MNRATHRVGWIVAPTLFLAIMPFVQAVDIYVSTTGSDSTGNGSSGAPYATIQRGIDAASSGDVVIVKDGTYGSVTNANLELSGLDFGGTNITVRSENGPAHCTIDCQDLGRAFFFHSGETTNSLVSGFTIVNGTAEDGAGIRCRDNSSPTIASNVFRNGSSTSTGGGISVRDSQALIVNNVLYSNYAAHVGGAIYDRDGGTTIRNNLLYTNVAGNAGGGIGGYAGTLDVDACTLYGNTAGRGGGISHSLGSSTILNCILWGNGDDISDSFTATYSCIEDGDAGTGNISSDPLFVDPDGFDFRLATNSPCIDEGTNQAWMAAATEIEGKPRILQSSVDMGAHEFDTNDYRASLTIAAAPSQRGTPAPQGYGTNSYPIGTVITNSVTSPADVSNGTRWVCTGWTGTGSVPASGTTNRVTFAITNASTLTWQWEIQYFLNVEVSGSGSVDVADGWYASGSNVTINASPAEGYEFAYWTGDLAPAARFGATLALTMDQSRSVTAHYVASNKLPVVSNVRAAQREGTKLVDIYYDVSDHEDDRLIATVTASTNHGATFDMNVAACTGGGYGAGVQPGTDHHIVWDMAADFDGEYTNGLVLRVSCFNPPPTMALVPGGTNSGVDPDAGSYVLTADSFHMDRTEVTKAQWDEIATWASSNGYDLTTNVAGKEHDHPAHSVIWYQCIKWCNARSEMEGRAPAYYTSSSKSTVYRSGNSDIDDNSVSWNSGYRLPTDTEREYAARGGISSKRYPWGTDTISHNEANYGTHPDYDDGPAPYTSPAGSFAANGYGLYDVAGNVQEWCWDWYPGFEGTTRITRGGNWLHGADPCKVASRSDGNPAVSHNFLGFRTCLPVSQSATPTSWEAYADSPAVTVDSRDYLLTVASDHGTPDPPVGTNALAWRATVTGTVDQAVQAGGASNDCAGWVGTGSVPASGSTADTGPVVLTNLHSSITWQWDASYLMDLTAGPNGSVNDGAVNGWHADGTQLTIQATPDAYCAFTHWSGDVPAGSERSGNGPSPHGNVFGHGLSLLGDLDGDGLSEAMVYSSGHESRGHAYVLTLNTDGTVRQYTEIGDNTGGGPPLSAGALFANASAGIGDLDGDGITEAALGSAGYGGGGAVYIAFMASNGVARSVTRINDSWNGGPPLATGDGFGFACTELGDLDGDGLGDIAVGAYLDDEGAEMSGSVYVLFLESNGAARAYQKISPLVGNGPPLSREAHFGISVTCPGDIDDDGVQDLAVGAYHDKDGEVDTGAVYLLFLRTNGTVKTHTRLNASTVGGLGLEENDLFGIAVASPGDMDGDGVEDIVVGACRDDDGDVDAGALHLLYLTTNGYTRAHRKISQDSGGGPELDATDLFGKGVAALGDLDGDHVVDLAVGAQQDDDMAEDAGAVYVLFLNTNGTVKAIQKITSSNTPLTVTMDRPRTITAHFTDDPDGDGLRDAWEMAEFGNLDQTADGDPDGDGATNLEEQEAGTDPESASSAPGLMAYYPFTGSADDATGNGRNGDVDAATPTTDGSGNAASAYAFDPGNYSSIYVDGLDLANTSFSICTWVRRASTTPSSPTIIGQGSRSANHGLRLGYEQASPCRYVFGFYGDDLVMDVPDQATKDVGEWHHLCATYDAATGARRLYRDGVLLTSDTAAAHYQGSDTLYIGAQSYTDVPYQNRYFHGKIDEVRIYGRALPSNEVAAVCHLGAPPLLTIAGNPQPHGTATPDDYGSVYLEAGTAVTNSVPALTDETGGVRWACAGWAGTGSVPPDGGTTNVSFTITNDSTVTWQWKPEYYLDAGASGSGTVSSVDGWYTNGATVSITATPETYWFLDRWSGDVPPGWERPGGGPDLDSDDRFSYSIAPLGDVDGDGVDDLLVGAPHDDDAHEDAGAAYVLFMQTNGVVRAHQKISELAGGGPDLDADDLYAFSAGGIADFDGDSVPDVVIGSRNDDEAHTNAGAVYVHFRATNGTVTFTRKITEGRGGPDLDEDDSFGSACCWLDDLDGDTVPELAVGARRDDDGSQDAGAIYILFLRANSSVRRIQKVSHDAGSGPALDSGDQFGSSLAQIGDLDGDGIRELVVGARNDDDGQEDAGALYVLFLRNDGTVRTHRKISATSGNGPVHPSASFGAPGAVAAIGDLDSDSLEEVATGSMVLYLNSNGTVRISRTAGEQWGDLPIEGEGFARMMAIGDLDGNGVDDIAAGNASAPSGTTTNAGALYLLFVSTNGAVKGVQRIAEDNNPLQVVMDRPRTITAVFGDDSDNDGVSDWWEMHWWSNLVTVTGSDDTDGDGLRNALEQRHNTDPTRTDTDEDGFSDYIEVINDTSPTSHMSYPSYPYREWTRLWGSEKGESGGHLARDASSGALYVGGKAGGAFSGQTYNGQGDYALSKFDENGNAVWARIWGSSGGETVQGMSVAPDGGVHFAATAPNPDSLYMVRFSADGEQDWVRERFGEASERAYDVAHDDLGNSYLIGKSGSIDGQVTTGHDDFCLIKYDALGVRQWTRLWGTGLKEIGYEVTWSRIGAVYAVGYYNRGLDVHGQIPPPKACLTRLDENGDQRWLKAFGSDNWDEARAVAADANGGAYVVGYTKGSFNGQTNSSPGLADVFVTKFWPDGTHAWTYFWGGPGADYAESVAVGPQGAVYVTGSRDRAPSLLRLSCDGELEWSRTWGSEQTGGGRTVAVDGQGNLFVAGTSSGDLDGQISAGGSDFFLTKWVDKPIRELTIAGTPAEHSTPTPHGYGTNYVEHGDTITNSVVSPVLPIAGTNGRIPLGTGGRGDNDYTTSPCVLQTPSGYQLWYSGRDESGRNRIYSAMSSDLLNWGKINNSIPPASNAVSTDGRLPEGVAGRGDSYMATGPSVVWTGDRYMMWYYGTVVFGPEASIFCATSVDGRVWSKVDNTTPLRSDGVSTDGRIGRGTLGRADEEAARGPCVILDDNGFKMWYTGDGHILYATSSNGLDWVKYNNQIPPRSNDISTDGRLGRGLAGAGDEGVSNPCVIKDGSLYKMWYCGSHGGYYSVFMATSPDGLTWTKVDNSIPSVSDGTSSNGRVPRGTSSRGDRDGISSPCVYRDAEGYHMWYSGKRDSTWRIFHATSPDGLTWTKTDNTIPSPADSSNGVRRTCTGWEGTGSVPPYGGTTNVTFTVTNDSTLTWQWVTEYELTVAASGSGTVDVATGWYTNGSEVTLMAIPETNHYLHYWSGDVPPGSESNGSIAVTMDAPKSVTAHFSTDTDGDGLEDWWEWQYFGDLDEVPSGDPDGDGLTNEQEVEHNTDPTQTDTDNDGFSDYVEVINGTSPTSHASRPSYPYREWTRMWGTDVLDTGVSVAADSLGNAYVVGQTHGDLDGQTNAGEADISLTRFDPGGERKWTRLIGTASTDYAGESLVDAEGNAYVVGSLNGANDLFLHKFNADGSNQWARTWGPTNNGARVHGGTVDSAGAIYICGYTRGALDGHPDPGDWADVFLTKYNGSGEKQWTRVWGSPQEDTAYGCATFGTSAVYVVGMTSGEFGSETNAGIRDVFLTKYSSSGENQWTRIWGTSAGSEWGGGVAVDAAGNVYAAATLGEEFDGQAHSGGGDDLAVSKFTSDGERLWTRMWDSSTAGPPRMHDVDVCVEHDRVYVAGYVAGTLHGQTHAGGDDACLVRLDTDGNIEWTRLWGGSGDDKTRKVHLGPDQTLFVPGWSGVAFDGQTNAGENDQWLTKWVDRPIHQLTIAGNPAEYSTPTLLGYGTNYVEHGEVVTNSVVSPVLPIAGTNGRIPWGTPGRGDAVRALAPSVLFDGTGYRMWYTGRNATSDRTYCATSSDGLSWGKVDNSIPPPSDTTSAGGRIPLGTTGAGDAEYAAGAWVIRDGENYRMWYTGKDAGSFSRIYAAASPDGLLWTKVDSSIPPRSDGSSDKGRIPLGTDGTGDYKAAQGGCVVRNGGTYHLWYTGVGADDRWRVFHASSSNGLDWVKTDNSIPPGSNGSSTHGRIPLGTSGRGDDVGVAHPAVVCGEHGYTMWYSGVDGNSKYRIYCATSPDGLNWTKVDNTIPASSDGTCTNGRIPLGSGGRGDGEWALDPSVVKDGSTYNMWYAGWTPAPSRDPRIYHATSPDGLTWTKTDNTIPEPADSSDGSYSIRLACTGYTGTGSIPPYGGTTNVTFTVTNDSTLTWQWVTEYELTVGTSESGTVDVASGWYTNGAELTLTAEPEVGAAFASWSGDVPPGREADNPLVLTMDGPRTVTPRFVTAPEIVVEGNGISIVNRDRTPTRVDHTRFGGVPLQAGSVDRTFTIRNIGARALSLTGTPKVAVNGMHESDFSVLAQPSNSVPVEGDTTFTVRFDPGGPGRRKAILTIENDDHDETVFTFQVDGMGVVPRFFPAVVEAADLNGTNGFVIEGIDSDDRSGNSVSGATDINSDGFADILVGAYCADAGGDEKAGEAYVVFGRSGGWASSLPLSSLAGTNGFRLDGIDHGDQLGFSVSGAGDINRDGFDDFIVGAKYANPKDVEFAGETYVIFGMEDAWPPALDAAQLDGANGYRLDGEGVRDFSGFCVSDAGDVNADGYADIAIGAPHSEPTGNTEPGACYVVFGAATTPGATLALSSLNGTNGFRVQGIDVDDYCGATVRTAGDVNGDGYSDVIISANRAEPAGECYVLFGGVEWPAVVSPASLDGTNGFRVDGSNSQLDAGTKVTTAGDINGDGYDDILMGAYYADLGGAGIDAESYLLFGRRDGWSPAMSLSTLDGTNGFRMSGIDNGDWDDMSHGELGDVNGDGYDDFIIGSRYGDPDGKTDAGKSFVVFGKPDGWQAELLLSSLNGTNGFLIVGVADGDQLGRSVHGAGDVNGDGYDDVIVGALRANPGGRGDAGESYVVFGGGLGVSMQLQVAGNPAPHGTPTPYSYGTHYVAEGEAVSVAVPSPADEAGGTRHVCAGWTGTGSVPATGDTATVSFTIETNSTLTWLWEAEHWLACRVSGVAGSDSGTVSEVDGWYAAGASVVVTATPAANHHFVEWSGDVASTNNPLALTMDQPYSVTASFAIDTYTIAATATAGGWISPSGSVEVVHGEGTNFTFGAHPNHHMKDVLVNGVSIGLTNAYTFANVTSNQSIHVELEPDTCNLTVAGSPAEHGSSSPYDYGVHGIPWGTVVTNTAATPADESNGVRWACTGWTGTGSVTPSEKGSSVRSKSRTVLLRRPWRQWSGNSGERMERSSATLSVLPPRSATRTAQEHRPTRDTRISRPVVPPIAGDGSTVVFTITTHSTLTWQWAPEYRLDTGSGGGGSVSPPDTWYPPDTRVAVTASPEAGNALSHWSGDVPPGSEFFGNGPAVGADFALGSGATAAGDLDGDGLTDAVIGAPYGGPGRHGEVHTLFLRDDGTVREHREIGHLTGGGPSLSLNDHFGSSLAGIGDLDNDGTVEIAVGAPDDNVYAPDDGAVYVLSMNSNGVVQSHTVLNAASGLDADLGANDRLGAAVAAVGDIDGNTTADMAVGAVGDDDGGDNAGAVYVLMLAPNASMLNYTKISASAGGGPTLDAGDAFGAAVAGLGTLDGDGVRDLAVGAPGEDDGSEDAGAVHILFMNAAGTVKSRAKISATSGGGPSPDAGDGFGSGVAHLGDVDGDGVGDLAVGAPYDDGGWTNAGAVYLLFMRADGSVKGHRKIGAAGGEVELDPEDRFGASVTALGDVDGDTVPDCMVGAPGDDDGQDNAGAAYILFLKADGSVKRVQKISQSNNPLTVTMDRARSITAHFGQPGHIALSRTELAASGWDCLSPSNATFEIWNAASSLPMTYSLSNAVDWLSVDPAAGECSWERDTITVSFDTVGMTAGTYRADITVESPEATNSPQLVSVALTVAATPIHYVDAASSQPVPPYLSWSNAAATIQDAIDVAANGDTVLVADGVYATGGKAVYGTMMNRVAIDKPITVKSAGGPRNALIVGEGPVGAGAVRCAYVTNNATLAGFTLTNGFTRGSVAHRQHEQSGGGVWAASQAAIVSNCIFAGCEASYHGGGLYRGTAVDCLFTNNLADSGGGMAYTWADRCVADGNEAEFEGGGAYQASLRNCLIVNNTADLEGGGVYYSLVYNCTVSRNSADIGGGVYDSRLWNSIVYDNHATTIGTNWSGGTIVHSCAEPLPDMAGPTNNITDNPRFRDPDGGDFRLVVASPCIDAGIRQQWMENAADVEGKPRVLSGAVDMGAYEKAFYASVRVCLEGAFATNTSAMRTALAGTGVLPAVAPYAADPAVAERIPSNATDWVLMELQNDEHRSVAAQSALLRNDGALLALDGQTNLLTEVSPGARLHMVIRHRNHLAIMSANPVSYTNEVVRYDFTLAPDRYTGSTNACVELEPGVWGMISGDCDGDGRITHVDGEIVRQQVGKTGYLPGDCNLDGVVTEADVP